jgi:tetratricopeptide (TPR) repeat protein
MNRTQSILFAAIAAVPLLASAAHAQYRVDDGRAHDANPQVGSGGYNSGYIPDPRSSYANIINGNRLITGNVTGGRAFTGQVNYGDPGDFRGNLGSASFDKFISSSASSARYVPPGTSVPFYGAKLAAPPPAGFEPQGFTGTFTPRPANSAGDDTNDRNRYSSLLTADPRLNYGNLETRFNSGGRSVPQTGDIMLQGPLDPLTNLPTLTTASPLLGVRTLRSSDLADRNFVANFSDVRGPVGTGLDPLQLHQMQEELSQSMGPARVNPNQLSPTQLSPNSRYAPGNPLNPGAINNDTNQQGPRTIPGQGENLAKPLDQPFDSIQNSRPAQPLDNDLTSAPIINGVETGASLEHRLATPPAKQSSQYAELERRLNHFYTQRLQTDEERNRDFLKLLRAREGVASAAGSTTPGIVAPDYARISQELVRGNAPANALPQPTPTPLHITSLAEGVRAKGLAGLLTHAETLMKEGKFMLAIQQYDKAIEVAPNNRLIDLGRANAEIGAGLYKRAEADLRGAIAHDPVTALAQFNLRDTIGQERLETIVKDLKDTAQKEKDDAGLPLLLAYVAYNTGAPQQAAVYLQESDKRSGGKDLLPKLLRSHWKLPGQENPAPAIQAVPAAKPTLLATADILKQFDEGNVASATLTQDTLSGQFRRPVHVPGTTQSILAFTTKLPPGAATGPLSRWITDHARGATIELNLPTTRPAR